MNQFVWLSLKTVWETHIFWGKVTECDWYLVVFFPYGVHPGRSKGGSMQPDITSGGKVPSHPLKAVIVISILTAMETEAQTTKHRVTFRNVDVGVRVWSQSFVWVQSREWRCLSPNSEPWPTCCLLPVLGLRLDRVHLHSWDSGRTLEASAPFLFLFLWRTRLMARDRALQGPSGPLHPAPQMWVCDLGSSPGWSSSFLSQVALGHFQRERWSVKRPLWINRWRQCAWRDILTWAWRRAHFTQGEGVASVFKKSGPIGTWFWGFNSTDSPDSCLYYLLIHSTDIFWAVTRYQVLCHALVVKWRTSHSPCCQGASMVGGQMSNQYVDK